MTELITSLVQALTYEILLNYYAILCIILTILAGVLGICLTRIKRKKKEKVVVMETVKEPEIPAELSYGTAQIIGTRENQQDSYSVSGDTQKSLCVVADGMGGLQNGAEISGIVSCVFEENYEQLTRMNYPEIELLHIVRSANEQAQSYIASTDGQSSGSTLVATYIEDEKLYFTSVGDSRIYLMRNKKLFQINRDHIYAYELEKEMVNSKLSEEEVLTHRERKSLTSYMGMGDLRHLDRNLEPVMLQKEDVILLASDGVFGTLSQDEMISAMCTSTAQQAAQNLIDAVLQKAKPRQDNATAVVVFYR